MRQIAGELQSESGRKPDDALASLSGHLWTCGPKCSRFSNKHGEKGLRLLDSENVLRRRLFNVQEYAVPTGFAPDAHRNEPRSASQGLAQFFGCFQSSHTSCVMS